MTPDRLTKDQRRKTMQAVKSTGSQIEQKLQKALWRRGFRYRKNYKKVFGKPDIVFVRLKIAVFVDSEFWHGFDWDNRKQDFKSGRDFWWNKIERNIARDKQVTEKLTEEGWIVIRFWGRQIEKNLDECVNMVSNIIDQRRLNK
jgi:DNA mismatch endonuclease (patch repair protein)